MNVACFFLLPHWKIRHRFCFYVFPFLDVSLKFEFSEKAIKFEKNLRLTFDESVMFCARNSILVKKSTKIFQNKSGQVVLCIQTLALDFFKP